MLNERQELLLTSIIENFIDSAEPVSSSLLAKLGTFDLSPATIRAEMNGLEELGLLTHLHTSGGRVPTDEAYRFFVDNMIHEEDCQLDEMSQNQIKAALNSASNDPRDLNKVLAKLLSGLSDNLVITNVVEQNDFYKTGLSSLFEMPEFKEFDNAFRLTNFFDEFESMFSQMARVMFAKDAFNQQGIRVVIGRENPVNDIKDETVMFAKYRLPQNFTGSLMLMGPMRMDYGRNIALIKCATEELNKLAKNT